MGLFDYLFTIIRNVSDLINILFYIALTALFVALAFYQNNKKPNDRYLSWSFFESFPRVLKHTLKHYLNFRFLRACFLFSFAHVQLYLSSNRLPYFLVICRKTFINTTIKYKKVKKTIKDFFKNSK